MSSAKQPNKYFDVVTYTGNGSTQDVRGLDFQPDLVWLKSRNNASNHVLYDTIRGTSQELNSNTTSASADQSGYGLTAFNTNGFSVRDTNGGYGVNGSYNYTAWCWKAGDTTETIAAGSKSEEAHNTSQVWSSDRAGSSFENVNPVPNAYNGDLGSYARVDAAQSPAISVFPTINSNDIVVWGALDTPAGGKIYIRDGAGEFIDVSSQFKKNNAAVQRVRIAGVTGISGLFFLNKQHLIFF